MIRIAICDDEAEHLSYTALLIRGELGSHDADIEGFPNAGSLLRAVRDEGYRPDIAVLDIVLEDTDGIDLAGQLNRLLPACRIIFLTGYADYAPESYKVPHVWFVTKVAAEKYLGPALRRALSGIPAVPGEPGVRARAGGRHFLVPLGDILYIDRYGRKARIVCASGPVEVSGRPGDLIGADVAPFFIRCHQGYWVNLKKIRALERNEFILSDGTHIPISRSYRDEARRRFFESFSK